MKSGIYRLIEYTSYNLQYDTTGNKIEWYCITKMRTFCVYIQYVCIQYYGKRKLHP